MVLGTDSDRANRLRIAAFADMHFRVASQGTLLPLLTQVAHSADLLVLCGDLTDHGLPEEARALAKELSGAVGAPIVAVLGNHDYESGHSEEVANILTGAGVTMLDGDAAEIRGIGFAGVKGFPGGFGRGTLSSFGEPAVKRFVQEALDEAMKLERALLQLRTPHRIAVLHYSPVRATVEGEPPEIFPYLGCSRLEEPLNRYQVTACVHGHAHHGAPEGRTATGVPVYNVALPLMRKCFPDRPAFRLLDIPNGATPEAPGREPVASDVVRVRAGE
ncbi:MAG: putative phosphoesterase [Phycisphaerales bacterium]|jgi:Icc-related predicted phosphoesterase|nr:putative phosphoesterase [Phycisphaerales bacterium]MDB5356883.1 putative phosphoesterase [Phycisphaerales bacterium]